MIRSFPLFLLFALVLTACDSQDAAPENVPAERAVVVNGGNFSDQNGHLSVWDPARETVQQLGDQAGFLHGIEQDEDRLLVLVSTFSGGRVDLLDRESLELTSQWMGLDAPRDVVVLDDDAWLVTSAFGSPGKVLRMNRATGMIQTETEVGFVPESIASFAGRIVVANNGSLGSGKTLTSIDPATGTASEVEVDCDGPRELLPDGEQLVLVCSGKTVYSDDFSEVLSRTSGRVLFLNTSLTETHRVELAGQPGSTNGTDASFFEPVSKRLFLTMPSEEEIVVLNTGARSREQTISVSEDNAWTGLSGIAYDPSTDLLYVGRFPVSAAGPFPDYASAGQVWILDGTGNRSGSFAIGASPSAILLQ